MMAQYSLIFTASLTCTKVQQQTLHLPLKQIDAVVLCGRLSLSPPSLINSTVIPTADSDYFMYLYLQIQTTCLCI